MRILIKQLEALRADNPRAKIVWHYVDIQHGFLRTMKDHTYINRLQTILEVVK